MRSNVLKFTQQGIWPSLSGGWYYDSNSSNFTNVFHLYVWFFLLCFPFILYLSSTLSWVVRGTYLATIITFFGILKFINHYLHQTFDRGEQLKKTEPAPETTGQVNSEKKPSAGSSIFDSAFAVDERQQRNDGTLSCDRKPDDDAGHMSLWDDIVRQDLEKNDWLLDDNLKEININYMESANVPAHSASGKPQEPSTSDILAKSNKPRTKHLRKKNRRKHTAVGKCESVPNASDSSESDEDREIWSWFDESDSSREEDEPSTSQGRAAHQRSSVMQRRVGFRNRKRPLKFSGRSLTHVVEQSPTVSEITELDDLDKSGDLAAIGDFAKETIIGFKNNQEFKIESGDHVVAYQRADIEQLNSETGSFIKRRDVSARKSSLDGMNAAEIMTTVDIEREKKLDFPPLNHPEGDVVSEATTKNTKLTKIKPSSLKENSEMQSAGGNSLASFSSASTPSDHSILDMENTKEVFVPATKILGYKGEMRMSDVMQQSKKNIEKCVTESKQGDEDFSGKSLLKLSHTNSSPEMSGSLPRNRMVPKNEGKKVNRFHVVPVSDDLYRRSQRESSNSSDSDTRNVDENYRRCLKNFQKIPSQYPERVSSAQSIRPGSLSVSNERSSLSSRTTALPARRSRSIGLPDASDPSVVSFRHTRLPSSSRHRHPAGEGLSASVDSMNPTMSKTRSSDGGGDDIITTSKEKPLKLHFATNHGDTSEGAVHSFQDEHGNWMTYTFGGNETAYDAPEESVVGQSPFDLPSAVRGRSWSRRRHREDSLSSLSARGLTNTDDLSRAILNFRSSSSRSHIRQQSSSTGILERQQLLEAFRIHRHGSTSPSVLSPTEHIGRAPTPKVKLFYKLKILPFKTVTIQYDRLALMDLLDRNLLTIESAISIFLAALVGILGLVVLSTNLLHDIWSFWFCVVMATSQFSLIRSVQPDSASPTHGHNRVIAYSRPVYFVISVLLLLLFDWLSDPSVIELSGIQILTVTLFDNAGFAIARQIMLYIVLLLPLIFLFGLLPQVNTFVVFMCEQLEINLFGGSASTSLPASLFSICRSVIAVMLLYGFCYGAMITQEVSQHMLFSVFCGLLVALSYHLSRQPSSPWALWVVLKSALFKKDDQSSEGGEGRNDSDDSETVSSKYIIDATRARIQSDIVLCPIIAVFTFALHCSTVFSVLKTSSYEGLVSQILHILVAVFGLSIHYVLPQLRKNLPWLLFAKPILRSREYGLFEITREADVMRFEKVFVAFGFIEKNFLFNILLMYQLTSQAPLLTDRYGVAFGCFILTVVGVKLARCSYSSPSTQYLVFVFSYLFVNYDFRIYSPSIIIVYFFVGILFIKVHELFLKLQFWFVYVGPWQITWGSAFHAFAQPFSVPHSAFLTAHAIVASIMQAPFSPFLGSALFFSSYARPLKFWEKNYNTKRIDNSNTRLASQVDRKSRTDDNNFNSIFYEHLTYSLQKSLAGDLAIGRWGNVYAGDYFILASDDLNALVHVIEWGNGVVTFQLRGLEFSGTYCQQREVEAINESADAGSRCCCFNSCKIPGMLSFNSAFNQRWLAWQVIVSNFVLDGYSISENNATTMLAVFELRKILITYIVKSVTFFLIAHDSLLDWIQDEKIRKDIVLLELPEYIESDPCFSESIDEDWDSWRSGMTLQRFTRVFGPWIDYCCVQKSEKSSKSLDSASQSKVTTLCFATSLLVRRTMRSNNGGSFSNLDAFLYGLHSVFKGDFRINAERDEWIFKDMNLLQQVIVPGVQVSIRLHQDHFACLGDDYMAHDALFEAIEGYNTSLVIAHEGDPQWRKAVLSDSPSLLALRRVVGDNYVDQYSVITLHHRALGFNVVKVNKECVRGLWAGQQNELVFMRNRNPERGSIQNAKQVLRNMINSSCDQPIGYPIYVSPLTTSYASTSKQYTSMIGQPVTFERVRNFFSNIISCLQQSCSGSCNSGGTGGNPPPPQIPQAIPMSLISARESSHRLSNASVFLPQQRPRADALPLEISRLMTSHTDTTHSEVSRSSTASDRQMTEYLTSHFTSRALSTFSFEPDKPRTRSRHTSCQGSEADQRTGSSASLRAVRHHSAPVTKRKPSEISLPTSLPPGGDNSANKKEVSSMTLDQSRSSINSGLWKENKAE